MTVTHEPVERHSYLPEYGDGAWITVHITNEGVIMDTYRDNQLSGTMGMTFDEWFDFVEGRGQ